MIIWLWPYVLYRDIGHMLLGVGKIPDKLIWLDSVWVGIEPFQFDFWVGLWTQLENSIWRSGWVFWKKRQFMFNSKPFHNNSEAHPSTLTIPIPIQARHLVRLSSTFIPLYKVGGPTMSPSTTRSYKLMHHSSREIHERRFHLCFFSSFSHQHDVARLGWHQI